MSGTPYPKKGSVITFREPFPQVEVTNRNGNPMSPKRVYYIKAIVDDHPERKIRMDAVQQMRIVDYLIRVDKKLTNAVVEVNGWGDFVIKSHSPQEDFFNLTKEG